MLKKVLAYYNWDFVQMQLNYYDWYCGNAEELYNILASADVPIMVMEPVHGRLLADLIPEAAAGLKEMSPERSVASWAMRWVLGRSQVQVVLASRPFHIRFHIHVSWRSSSSCCGRVSLSAGVRITSASVRHG